MSNVLVDTTWAADAPYTLTNATRSGGKLIIDGNPAADSNALYTLANADRPASGSARGFAIAFHITDFSMIADTSGGLAPVIEFLCTGNSGPLYTKTGRKLSWLGADSAALTLTTLYQLDGLYTEESGGRARLWIDGVLSFDQRNATSRFTDLNGIRHGLTGGLGKITYEFRFGHTKIWSQRDAT